MKKLKILTVCIALITLPVLIESCCLVSGPGSCGCGSNNMPTNFDIKSMVVTTVSRGAIGRPDQFDPPSPGTLDNHAFYVLMDAEYRQALLETFRPTMAAYACSPVEPVGDQRITDISITSNNQLTTTLGAYPAGLDLIDLFRVSVYGGDLAVSTILDKDLYSNLFYLVSNEKVDVTQKHIFTINVSLDDGRTFTLVAPEAELIPN